MPARRSLRSDYPLNSISVEAPSVFGFQSQNGAAVSPFHAASIYAVAFGSSNRGSLTLNASAARLSVWRNLANGFRRCRLNIRRFSRHEDALRCSHCFPARSWMLQSVRGLCLRVFTRSLNTIPNWERDRHHALSFQSSRRAIWDLEHKYIAVSLRDCALPAPDSSPVKSKPDPTERNTLCCKVEDH